MSIRVRRQDGKVVEFRDGTPPEEIAAAMKAPLPDSAPPLMMTPQYNPATAFLEAMKGRAIGALPTAGGLAGGLVGMGGGLAGSAAGSAVGGAAGEALKEHLSGQELSPGWIAGQGALQGGLDLAGGLAAKGVAKAAPALMSRALGNLSALSERFSTKAAQLTPEDIIKMHLEDKLTATPAGKAAAAATGDLARAARSDIFAGTSGTIGAPALASKAIAATERNIQRRLTPQERAELTSIVEKEVNRILTESSHGVVPKGGRGIPAQPASSILDEYGRPAIPASPASPPPPTRYTAREVEQIKEVAAKDAKGAYKADINASSVAADPALSKQIADAARAKLGRIPGVKEQTDLIKRSMIEQQAIRGALKRGNSEWTPIHVGPLSIGAKLPRDKMSQLALLLANKRFQTWVKLSPRLAAESINQLLYSAEPDATNGN